MSRVIAIDEIFRYPMNDAARRERRLSQLLVSFIIAGLAFMLLPGTFLGLWNLFAISSNHSAKIVSSAWVQAHGHAQVFGWIGCFILGIGFHSIPKMTGQGSGAVLGRARFSLVAWITGVSLRWAANVYLWHWRVLLPVSALLELTAFLVFFRAVSQHKPTTDRKRKVEPWILVVIAGTVGWLATLLLNLYGCVLAALHSDGPAFGATLDQKFLALMAWGFLVPHVWGFSAKWLPIFLGLRPGRPRALIASMVVNALGLVSALYGYFLLASLAFLAASVIAAFALRIFETPEGAAKSNGVHSSFPWFVRFSYGWLQIAALLGVWASRAHDATGIWGASRHALTVGFVAGMVFCIGQRVLPAFSGMKLLWSTRLMFANTALLTLGCALRVSCEVIAYQGFNAHAWSLLPVSAVIEMSAVTCFAVNLILTFMQSPAHETRLRHEAATARAAVS